MMDRLMLPLYEPAQAHAAIATVWKHAKPLTQQGKRMVIELREEKRSDRENALLHVLLGHIAKTQEWAGKRRDSETWKRLLTAAWLRARGEHIEMLPALDGHGIDVVFRRTSDLTRSECAELIDFIHAWAAGQGIEFPPPPEWREPEPKRGKRATVIDADTGEIMETA